MSFLLQGLHLFLSTRIQESNQTLVCRNLSDGEMCRQTFAFDCKPGWKTMSRQIKSRARKVF